MSSPPTVGIDSGATWATAASIISCSFASDCLTHSSSSTIYICCPPVM